MDNNMAAENLIRKICDVDNRLNTLLDTETKEQVMNQLRQHFDTIVRDYPHLLNDIQQRIVTYHANRKSNNGLITDFIQLVEWYKLSLPDHPADYWNTTGDYYNLRMNEVITMFLIARHNS